MSVQLSILAHRRVKCSQAVPQQIQSQCRAVGILRLVRLSSHGPRIGGGLTDDLARACSSAFNWSATCDRSRVPEMSWSSTSALREGSIKHCNPGRSLRQLYTRQAVQQLIGEVSSLTPNVALDASCLTSG